MSVITFKFSGMKTAARRMQKRAKNVRRSRKPLVKKILVEVLKVTQNNFDNSGLSHDRPNRWAPLALSTFEQKVVKKGFSPKPLIRSGARGLRGMWTIRADAKTGELTSQAISKKGAPYGIFHHTGGRNLPKRRFLPLPAHVRRLAAEFGVNSIKQSIKVT